MIQKGVLSECGKQSVAQSFRQSDKSVVLRLCTEVLYAAEALDLRGSCHLFRDLQAVFEDPQTQIEAMQMLMEKERHRYEQVGQTSMPVQSLPCPAKVKLSRIGFEATWSFQALIPWVSDVSPVICQSV